MGIEQDPARRNAMIREAAGIVQQEFGYIPLHQQGLAWGREIKRHAVQLPDDYFPLRFVQVK